MTIRKRHARQIRRAISEARAQWGTSARYYQDMLGLGLFARAYERTRDADPALHDYKNYKKGRRHL